MKKNVSLTLFCLIFLCGCQRSSNQVWEDVKTAGRYLNKGIDSICGKDYDSRLITNEGDFTGPAEEDFIPLNEKDLKTQFRATDTAIRQSKYSPEGKNNIPYLDKFQVPPRELNAIFRLIYFDTDDHVVREREDLITVQRVANYMKKHSKDALIIEGHCDERASAAYNMALGTRRANHIRVLLIKQGVDFNRIYTVSYGKEKPLALGHTTEDWKKNRRSQFKIYRAR